MKIIYEEKKRKNMVIKILNSEEVLVSYANFMGKDKATAFVEENIAKIKEAQLKMRKQEEFKKSDDLYYLGKKYHLKMEEALVNEVIIIDSEIVVKHTDRVNPSVLYNKYLVDMTYSILKDQFNKRLLDFPNLPRPKIIIKGMKSRWGYCNYRDHVVCLNSCLIMCPMSCIDYVVVHELLHFTYHDHQKAFHDHLESIIPSHRKLEKELKSFGFLLK